MLRNYIRRYVKNVYKATVRKRVIGGKNIRRDISRIPKPSRRAKALIWFSMANKVKNVSAKSVTFLKTRRKTRKTLRQFRSGSVTPENGKTLNFLCVAPSSQKPILAFVLDTSTVMSVMDTDRVNVRESVSGLSLKNRGTALGRSKTFNNRRPTFPPIPMIN